MSNFGYEQHRPHRVGITGAIHTGRSELARVLSERPGQRDVPIIDNSKAYEVYLFAYPLTPPHRRYSYMHQNIILSGVMSMEEQAEERMMTGPGQPDLVIADGTLFDPAVRAASTGNKNGAEHMLGRVKMWGQGRGLNNLYPQLYVLNPADVPYEDTFGTISSEQRQIEHEMFRALFNYHGIGYSMLSGTLEERADRVIGEMPETERQKSISL